MKLCIDTRMLFASGIGTYLRNILYHLQTSSWDITLLLYPEDREKLPFLKAFSTIALSSPIYSIQEQFELPLKIPKCDLFWSPHFNIPLLPIRAKKRIVTIHDTFHLAHLDSLSIPQRFYAQFFFKAAALRSSHIFTPSEFSKSEIIKYLAVPEEKITVAHLAADREFFSQGKKEKKKRPYALFVSNVKPHKNLRSLLQAFSQYLQKSGADLDLLIVGKKEGFINGDQIAPLLQNAPLLEKHVQFTGYVTDDALRNLYAGAQFLIFPSFYEGFGLPPLEAMAARCPVLASNAASIPEICAASALYFDPANIEEIASAIERVQSSQKERERLIDVGEKRVAEFSWKRCSEIHLSKIASQIQA